MKLEHRVGGWLVALTALAIVGCEANRYEIEMTPTRQNRATRTHLVARAGERKQTLNN